MGILQNWGLLHVGVDEGVDEGDTIVLAVFRKPASACEALRIIHSQYNIHALDENDNLLSLLSDKDLEPPFPRLLLLPEPHRG